MTAPATTPTDAGQGLNPAPVTDPAPVATDPAPSAPGVQPTEPEATAQPDGGQGLIAPYLEGVDETVRDTVADALERYRQDSDREISGRFEELSRFKSYVPEGAGVEYLEQPVAIYENLLESPLETVQWIVEQFESGGVNLKAQLLEALQGQSKETPTGEAPDDDLDRPLTRREWEQLQQEQAAQAEQETQRAQQTETVKGWLNEAASSKGLELAEEDVALRQAILTHAAQLVQRPEFRARGQEAGKAAIETAVEAFVNRFGKTSANDPEQTPEPRLADGGTPPAPSDDVDMTDPKQRRAFMLQRIKALQTQE